MNVNGTQVDVLKSGFHRFQFCRPSAEVDVENDEFQFQTTSDNGVCITSLNVNGEEMRFGPQFKKRSSFWMDGNNSVCHRELTSTPQITFKNGAIDSYVCDECPDAVGSTSMGTVLPPLYGEVDQVKECVGSTTRISSKGTSFTIKCKPAEIPVACPEASWDQLYGHCGVGTLFDDC